MESCVSNNAVKGDTLIKANDISIYYGKVEALKSVSLTVFSGDFIVVTGPNGGGKTSLIKTVLGLIKPSKGNIWIKENTRISYVEQVTLFDREFPISVEEILLSAHLPSEIKLFYKHPKASIDHAVKVMKDLDIIDLKKRQIGELSGGQLQRVLLGRALMSHPSILLLDEPTAGVDENSRSEIYKMLKSLNKSLTIILITHDIIDDITGMNRHIRINKTIINDERLK